MRTRQTKQEFIYELTERIAIRNAIMDFYNNVYLPTLQKFDGKVYNIRFIKALREKVADNRLFYISERKYTDGVVELQMRRREWNYSDYESLYAKCNLNSEGRIDYNSTINDKLGNTWIENFNAYKEEYQRVIDNYDAYMQVGEKLEAALGEWNKLPHPFRQNIDTTCMRIY